ncbi:alpha/beta fold hydrolase [Plantactinospora sp. GCM10030261]|uniref:alpha/beta fold hydrolase n=1 Tax=Plantactinospora sp. GCM10030261 TaxID=3273420 RepID=UPI0036236FCD
MTRTRGNNRWPARLGRATGVALLAGLSILIALAGTAVATLVTDVPAVFLAVGVLTGLGTWLTGVRVGRWRPMRHRTAALAGGVGTVVLLGAVLVPLGDPVRVPAPPPGAGTWTLPDGGRLAYGMVPAPADRRSGAPVVVLHGGPGVPDLAGMLTTLGALAVDGRDVWAYAQRGSGGSSRLADPGGYTVDLAVADLEEVRRRIGADRMVLLGHSYGGFLAAAYAAAHPRRVERLVLSSPGDLAKDGVGGMPQRRLEAVDRWRLYRLLAPPRALLAYTLLQVSPAAAHAFAGDRELDARQDRVYAATRSALHCADEPPPPPLYGNGFFANQVPQSASRPPVPDVAGRLRGLPLPTLVVKGRCDYLDWASATGYLDVLPDSRLAYLPEAGHDAWSDDPDGFRAVVRAFLTGDEIPGLLPDPHRPPADYQG